MLRAATDFCCFPGWTPDVKSSAPADNSSPAIDKNVNGRLFTAGAWVRSQVNSCGICSGQIGTGAVYLQALRCSPFNINPPMLDTYLLIYYGRYIIVATDSVVKYHTWKIKIIIRLLKIPVWFILKHFSYEGTGHAGLYMGYYLLNFSKWAFWQITLKMPFWELQLFQCCVQCVMLTWKLTPIRNLRPRFCGAIHEAVYCQALRVYTWSLHL